MNVYEFEKSLLKRMEESRNVLQCKGAPVPASEVREEWACHVELIIEPAGWQGIWKLNRATCEYYKVKYPTVVLGTVNNVYFQDLIAEFSINAVQDDDVHLPTNHEVPLEDLWPTINQENTELDIERTANVIDELRFFYRNVWMPWDEDDDDEIDWRKKHLDSRIQFCFDLKRNMSRSMADHIRKLMAEARYIRTKREIMEMEMNDDEDAEEDPKKVQSLMRMQLRMMEVRNEIEMLENPVFRRTYEDVHFKTKSNNNNVKYDQKSNVYIVTKEDSFTKQLEYFESARNVIGADEIVKLVPSLKDCLKVCVSRDYIYLPPGRHDIKLLEPLNSNGLLKAVSAEENSNTELDANAIDMMNNKTVVTSEESDNVFLMFNGDYQIENMILDCRHVRIGICAKGGTVTLKNCQLIGDRSSSTAIGIGIAGDAKCVLEKTLIQNFATGLTCAAGGTLVLSHTIISNCGTGLETSDGGNIQIVSSQMTNNSDYAVFVKTKAENVFANGKKKTIVTSFEELAKLIPSCKFNGDFVFTGNGKGNIAVADQNSMVSLQHSEFLEDNYDESGFTNTDVSMSNGKFTTEDGHSSPILIDENDEDDANDESHSFHQHESNNQSSHTNTDADVSIICID